MSEKENFLTIKEAGQNELIIKKSRFIASFARTDTKEKAEAFVKEISKKYHDATHNTYAYTIGLNDDQVKASDNGEPQGTAGVVELRALQLMKLKNVTVVVTRYFGGIKLGAGGLIRAYSNSVTEAAKAIGVVKRVLQKELTFSIAYNRLDEINHYLEENNVFVSNREYGTDVTFTLFVEDKDIEPLEADLTDLLKGKVDLKEIGQRYNEILLKDVNYHEQ
ncbi:YigZ family protein [Lactobacillus mulieris]|uniref:YigZ family protein n=1 Tax=Lactobacillus mulieris TaxID=2508708 RepID=A0AAW5WVD0_9LACO|nr:YigZ family protein [Lactobacillus mulieris]MCZ3621264.1 YigZ family protein [Lactobacillus mulieris]MCZ3624366.1 YigZ family protein [Lactobacillus mulieris]MCZ3635272.1 YigZ family protein [Lactobacillus mulieris]MCZ3689559.1 YigZ family protein [Lactobacillus mulieris]MCZ3695562.1 YigZ family protein [Lactobacillus mulieris]